MNKKSSAKLKKTIISAIIFLVLSASLFVFTSCKSDYSKTLDADKTAAASGSSAVTNEETGTSDAASNQTTAAEKETTAETSENETTAAAATETTAQPVDPAAQQIIEVTASGGYSPRKIEAKADIPTILVMKSEGAYGCERAFNIPDLKISEILPENGQTQFDLGTQAKGTELLGVCSMGMYYFKIFFN